MPNSYLGREEQAAPVGSEVLPEPLRTVILNALDDHATDIHLDPLDEGLLIRHRVDGIVHVKELVSVETGRRLLNEVRVLCGLDTERTFVPLEAPIGWWDGEERRDIRVSIVPTGEADAAHLRLLSASEMLCDAKRLGLAEEDLDKALAAVRAAHGLILVAGPTGAGKTTTLYSLVSALDLKETVAVSIEDPVEIDLAHLRQVGVNEKHGLTMYEGVRALLRMDPDVILIGEIRDQQSAIAAARAALAGRLVLATIHAADAATAIEAMHYLSVPSHILGGSIRLAIAQSLVRRVCVDCGSSRPIEPHERALFQAVGLEPPEKVRRAPGCKYCRGYGYSGRIGVFETAAIDADLAEAITAGAHHQELRKLLRERGTRPLLADALAKVAKGTTTMEEVFRVHWPGEGNA